MSTILRIAVISDTHLDRPTPWFERFFDETLTQADLLLHCGDHTSPHMVARCQEHPGYHGVLGNSDHWSLAETLPTSRLVTAGAVDIGLVHGWGEHQALERRAAEMFGDTARVVCFGHTHRFLATRLGGVLVVNPGSLCSPRDGGRSMAWLTVSGGDVQVEERRLDGDCR